MSDNSNELSSRSSNFFDILWRYFTAIISAPVSFFRSRVIPLRIVKLNHLLVDHDNYSIIGPTPYLELDIDSRPPPSLWITLVYKFDCPDGHMGFALYYDSSSGFKSTNRKFITLFNDDSESVVINLKGSASRFRLDPFANEGSFKLENLSLIELGKFQVICKFIGKHLKFISFNPARIFSLFSKALTILREDGFTALKYKIFSNRNSNNYTEWVQKYGTLSDQDRVSIIRNIEGLHYKPVISVIMPTYNTAEEWLIRAIESVRAQIYPNWELCIADDCSTKPHVKEILSRYAASDIRINVLFRESNGQIGAASNTALSMAKGEYCAFLDHDDELSANALYMVVDAVNNNPSAKLIYSDEDKIALDGSRTNPYFKSNWNPELLLSQNYICHFTAIRRDLIRKVDGFRESFSGSQDWDLLLRVSEHLTEHEIVHVPHILYHWRMIPESVAGNSNAKPYAIEAAKRAVSEHLVRTKQSGTVEIIDSLSQLKVIFDVPHDPPLVTLIILTKDKVKLLEKCINSILAKTNYPNYEITIVDNGSKEEATIKYLNELKEDKRFKILTINEPFNFSRLNNLAAAQANGEILGFLNNDLEVINDGWLKEMVSHAVREKVGAVGARLWFPNNLIQHAGVILGIGGIAGHSLKGIEKGNPGYFNRAVLTQNFSAVTAACMLIKKETFYKIKGFNEHDLHVAFNDVDFCLRLNEIGYRNIYTPYAELYHYESASRGYENTPQKFNRFEGEVDYMKKRWGHILRNDPYYNPNLTLFDEDYSLAFPPRVPKIPAVTTQAMLGT